MRISSAVGGVVVGALVAASVPARAQVKAPVRYNEGPGIKLTDSLVLHPGISVEGRYDTNVFAADSVATGTPVMRFIAHIDLATLPPQRRTDGDGAVSTSSFTFRLGGNVSYRFHIPTGGDPFIEGKLTDQNAFETEVGLALGFSPGRIFKIRFSDDFARIVSPRADGKLVGPVGVDIPPTSTPLPRLNNRATVGIEIAPGGGRLSFGLSYSLNIDFFESAKLDALDRLFHSILFEGKWRLLPKTAFLLRVTQQFYGHPNAGATAPVASKPFRATFGLQGLLTRMITVGVHAGYGNGFYDTGTNFSSVLARAEVGFAFTPTAKLRVGYEFGFEDSVTFNYYDQHKVYARYDQQFGRLVLAHLSGDFYRRGPEGVDTAGNDYSGGYNVGVLSAGVDFQLLAWLSVGVGYDLDLISALDPALADLPGSTGYTKHQAYGKVGISY